MKDRGRPEALERHLRELPGVTRVELTFPRGGA